MAISTSTGDWIRQSQPRSHAEVRLFCLPYAGGGASIYRRWRTSFPPTIEVLPVQLPGREARFNELPFSRLNLLVEALAEAIQPWLTLPFAFWGHSMGALIGFELARYLRTTQGILPAHLFVSAHRAAQLPDRRTPIHQLPTAAFLAELHALNGTPEAVLHDSELMALFLPLLKADFALCETYTYAHAEPLLCPISAFGGLEDREISGTDLQAWAAQTDGDFRLHMLPGDHFFLHNVHDRIAQIISWDLK